MPVEGAARDVIFINIGKSALKYIEMPRILKPVRFEKKKFFAHNKNTPSTSYIMRIKNATRKKVKQNGEKFVFF